MERRVTVEFAHGKRGFTFVLILSGGNALGAFQAGVYQALHEAGLEPDWVIGASAGAINAGLIVGNEPEERLAKLAEFWGPSPAMEEFASNQPFETTRRSAAVQWTLMAGRRGVFGPLLSGARWFRFATAAKTPSLFETEQLVSSLNRLINFERLNGGCERLTVTAVDVESGEDVAFDTRDGAIRADHFRASAALPVAFPVIEIEGRWLADSGLSANLPLDPFFAEPPSVPTLCLAVDLLPLHGQRPTTIGEAATRMQDIVFAAQSRRSIARWTEHYRSLPIEAQPSIAFARIAYADQSAEVAGKAMDFSPRSIRDRWVAGLASVRPLIERLHNGAIAIGAPGVQAVNVDV
jgi:NTE family protein